MSSTVHYDTVRVCVCQKVFVRNNTCINIDNNCVSVCVCAMCVCVCECVCVCVTPTTV